MSVRITEEDILTLQADAAVIGVEIAMDFNDSPVCSRLAEAAGPALAASARAQRFLPAGSACPGDPGALPFPQLILAAAPRWLTGKANELLVLHRCYESVFSLAEELGCRSLVTPFLSACYYRFPSDEAIRIAREEAGRHELEVCFVADTPALYEQSFRPYHRPEIRSYVGYYRDHALFALDNGLFARVDLRPENRDVALIPYFEACYRAGNNPLQPALPEAEIARLRAIYEESDW